MIDYIGIQLDDFEAASGESSGHYFHQDLLVAQFIHEQSPKAHLDVGSRIDGFVAHVASFRPVEVLDIRTLKNGGHSNIKFVQADLMLPQVDLLGRYDSVSCLHALEHFGLGRYSDQINPQGHRRGFDAISALVKPGGRFYLSVPVGRPAVHFNAHRIFDPREVIAWSEPDFRLLRFDFVDDAGDLHQCRAPQEAVDFSYGCGIYTFLRRIPLSCV